MCSYFNVENKIVYKHSTILKDRKNRKNFFNWPKISSIRTGDILSVIFRKRSIIYRFEGICLRIKNKSFLNLNSSIMLRNILFGISIEVTFSYFYNRIFFLQIQDYKRKKFWYKRSKLYYLRNKLNRASRVV